MEALDQNVAAIRPAEHKTSPLMKDLLQEKGVVLSLPKVGDVVPGVVIEKSRSRIFLDLKGFRTGVLYKTELEGASASLQEIRKGDTLTVKVVDLENSEGLVEVSLTQATLDQVWEEIKNLKAGGAVLEVKILGANRGGLVAQVNGLAAFLPVSQLSSGNYPHVEGGDKEEILKMLKKFVGQTMVVKVLDFDQKNSKVILSEKAGAFKDLEAKLSGYKVGDTVEGEVSGLVDFGAFVMFDGIEGLVHISEIGWQLVEKPSDVLKIGDKVAAKIIALEGDKVSLSLKILKPNPWDEVDKKYQKGGMVMGTVVKFNPFGAFVKLDSEIQGLAHISEFKNYKDMTSALELGRSYQFRILSVEAKEYKLALQPAFELPAPVSAGEGVPAVDTA